MADTGDRNIVNFSPNERVDLPDFQAIQDNCRSETRLFAYLLMCCDRTPNVFPNDSDVAGLTDAFTNFDTTVSLKPFTLDWATNSTDLTVTAGLAIGGFGGSAVTDSESGVLVGFDGETSQTISFNGAASGSYGIFVSASFDPSSPGARIFWNPGTAVESSQTVNTRLAATWSVTKSVWTSGSPATTSEGSMLVGTVVWSGSAFTNVTMRTFSLWEGGIETSVTADGTMTPVTFGGTVGWGGGTNDRNDDRIANGIQSLAEWVSAVRRQLTDILGMSKKNVQGGWYSKLPLTWGHSGSAMGTGSFNVSNRPDWWTGNYNGVPGNGFGDPSVSPVFSSGHGVYADLEVLRQHVDQTEYAHGAASRKRYTYVDEGSYWNSQGASATTTEWGWNGGDDAITSITSNNYGVTTCVTAANHELSDGKLIKITYPTDSTHPINGYHYVALIVNSATQGSATTKTKEFRIGADTSSAAALTAACTITIPAYQSYIEPETVYFSGRSDPDDHDHAASMMLAGTDTASTSNIKFKASSSGNAIKFELGNPPEDNDPTISANVRIVNKDGAGGGLSHLYIDHGGIFQEKAATGGFTNNVFEARTKFGSSVELESGNLELAAGASRIWWNQDFSSMPEGGGSSYNAQFWPIFGQYNSSSPSLHPEDGIRMTKFIDPMADTILKEEPYNPRYGHWWPKGQGLHGPSGASHTTNSSSNYKANPFGMGGTAHVGFGGITPRCGYYGGEYSRLYADLTFDGGEVGRYIDQLHLTGVNAGVAKWVNVDPYYGVAPTTGGTYYRQSKQVGDAAATTEATDYTHYHKSDDPGIADGSQPAKHTGEADANATLVSPINSYYAEFWIPLNKIIGGSAVSYRPGNEYPKTGQEITSAGGAWLDKIELYFDVHRYTKGYSASDINGANPVRAVGKDGEVGADDTSKALRHVVDFTLRRHHIPGTGDAATMTNSSDQYYNLSAMTGLTLSQKNCWNNDTFSTIIKKEIDLSNISPSNTGGSDAYQLLRATNAVYLLVRIWNTDRRNSSYIDMPGPTFIGGHVHYRLGTWMP